MPKIGGKRKKTRTHKDEDFEEQALMGQDPKSFIIRRGKVNPHISQLVLDMRNVMYPYTSMKLKESDKNKIKDYVNACKTYGVSHLVMFTSSSKHNYMRLIKSPHGPTISFKIVSYCTQKDVINATKKSYSRSFVSPLLIMNGFSKIAQVKNNPTQAHYDLFVKQIQAMYPSLSLKKCQPKKQKRCILFQYDAEYDTVIMRQFHVEMVESVSNQNLKPLIFLKKKAPNLHSYNSFKQYVNQAVVEDIQEECEEQKELQKKVQHQIQLTEMGPRIKLKIYKIEEGLMGGNVLYNRLVHKDEKEKEAMRQTIRDKLKEKQQRKLVQEENVKAKKQEKDDKENGKRKMNDVDDDDIQNEINEDLSELSFDEEDLLAQQEFLESGDGNDLEMEDEDDYQDDQNQMDEEQQDENEDDGNEEDVDSNEP